MNNPLLTTLNRLLHAESASLIHRLVESNPYAAWTSSSDRLIIDRIARDCRGHQHALARLILTLRGMPEPHVFPTEFGSVHYLDLSFLMPQVIANVRGLIREYESAAGTGHPDADALIARHLADHRRHLAELEKLHANLATT